MSQSFVVIAVKALCLLLLPITSFAACLLDGSANTTSRLVDANQADLRTAASNNWDITTCDVSGLTSMHSMFKDLSSFNQNIGGWDVSGVTSMGNLFDGASAFNQDISSWNVSSVTDMWTMFQNASAFNQDISNWNVSSAVQMGSMFKGASAFNQNIGGWNVSSVISIRSMFERATSFNQNIGGWNVAAVTDMQYAFKGATAFNQNLGSWNVAAVTTMQSMFESVVGFNHDLSSWNVAAVTDMSKMFLGASAFNQNLGGWNISAVTTMENMLKNTSLSTANYDAILTAWSQKATLQSNVSFGVGSTKYTAQAARNVLTGQKSWNIQDGGRLDTAAPVFTSSANVSVAENQTSALQVNATDDSAVIYSISGTDASLLSIYPTTGVVTFNTAPDYEVPSDSDANNTYVFTVTATDTANNAASQAITVTVTDGDDTLPRLVSSAPADGANGVALNANLVLTFSEAVTVQTGNLVIRRSDNHEVIESIGVTSAQVTGSGSDTITVDPRITYAANTGYYVTIDATAFKDASGNAYAGISSTTALNFTSFNDDPRAKADVPNLIRAWGDMAVGFADNNIHLVQRRLDYVRRHQGERDLSQQGIRLRFTDPHVDRLLNAQATTEDWREQLDNVAASMNHGESLATDQVVGMALSEGMLRARKRLVSGYNPGVDSGWGDWSYWSAGEILVGERKASEGGARQEVKTKMLAFGLDKPLNQEQRMGLAFTVAQDEVDVGTEGSMVEGANYGISGYASVLYPQLSIAGLLGYGALDFDSQRMDGDSTLKGTRRGEQLFFSLALQQATPWQQGSFSVSPYGRVDASYSQLQAFTETGDNYPVYYAKQNIAYTSVAAGLDMYYQTYLGNDLVKPYAKLELGASRRQGDDARVAYVVTSQSQYAVDVAASSDSGWRAEMGADIVFDNGAVATMFYSQDRADNNVSSQRYGLRLGWSH